MALAIDERTVRHQTCTECGTVYAHVTGFVLEDGNAHSVYYAACHGHPEHEAWLDVILGSWGEGDSSDHVTFSCQLRAEGAAAVDSCVAVKGEAEAFGEKLTRVDALAHDLLSTFWDVVDLIALEDPTVREHVYGSA